MELPIYQTEEDALVVCPGGWTVSKAEDAFEKLPTGRIWERKELFYDGTVPVLDQSLADILGFHRDEAGVSASPESPVVTFANHTCAMRFVVRPFSVIQNVFPLVGRRAKTDTRFLFYWLNRRVHIEEYKGHFPDLRRLWFPLPPLAEQRAIAGVLGALDDKIESNRRQIRVLDDLFMTECSSLMIQAQVEGIHRLADLAEISLGGTPSRANPDFWIDGEIPWINSGCLHERPVLTPADFITELGCTKSATKVIPAGATVVAITGATLGVISRLGISCAINQSVVAISTREAVNDPYLHFWMRSNISDLVSSATGAAQQHVNKSNFEELRVEVPTRSVLDQVGAHGVLLDRQVSLAREAKTLILLRDTLLPELLSGRLRVRDAERVVEGAM